MGGAEALQPLLDRHAGFSGDNPDVIETWENRLRQLEREIGRVMRHAAMKVADDPQAQVHIGPAELSEVLGPPRFEHDIALRSGLLALLSPKLTVDVAQGVELALTLVQPPRQLAGTLAR